MYKVSTLPVASSSTYAMQPMYDNEAELEDHDNDGSYSTLRTGIHFDDLNTSGRADTYIRALHNISDKSEKVNELIKSYRAIFSEHKGKEEKDERKRQLKLWADEAASHVPPKPPGPPKLIEQIRVLVTRQTKKEVIDMLHKFIDEFETNTDKNKKQKWSRKVRKYCETHKLHLEHQPVQNRGTANERYEMEVHNNKIVLHKIPHDSRGAKARTRR